MTPHTTYIDDPKIVEQLSNHLSTQLALCDALEKVADSLPNNVDTQTALRLTTQIYATIKHAHQFEEEQLFPLITNNSPSDNVSETLQQLHSDHWEDESYAFELQDALLGYITKPKSANPEALGYMLRGFFKSLRRHIAFERQYFSTHLPPHQPNKVYQS